MILVDTSVWIDFFRPRTSPQAATLRALLERDEPLAITGLVFAELLQGVSDPLQARSVKEQLLVLSILDPAGLATYEEAAALYRACRSRGETVRSLVDCVIAAVAIENGLPVLHHDRDYDVLARHSRLRIYPAG